MLRKFGDILIALGAIVGIGAIVGYELDIIPPLPPVVLKLLLYKLLFIGGIGMLAAGAFARRVASRLDLIDSQPGTAPRELPPPPAQDLAGRAPTKKDAVRGRSGSGQGRAD
ncbi:MAG: hypothetical protein ABI469_04145 [Gemmatimonadales bacterium]